MYDVVIIGCGPAGMTAGLYLLRANKKVLILEKETIGGQIASSPLVENYPGFQSISGSELADNMYEQVIELGATIELEEAKQIIKGKPFKVVTDENVYETKSIIIATGSKFRLLGLTNEENLIGSGIHFCVSCDGSFYKDKVVAVIGGSNTALINALYLSDICKKVYLIARRDYLTAETMLQDKLKSKDNVEIMLSTQIKKIEGEESLKSIVLNDDRKIELDGMFIAIGQDPQNDFVKDIIKLDDKNYIDSEDCLTNVEGIFTAGDCRKKKFRQLTTACNDGTVSAMNAINYLDNYK